MALDVRQLGTLPRRRLIWRRSIPAAWCLVRVTARTVPREIFGMRVLGCRAVYFSNANLNTILYTKSRSKLGLSYFLVFCHNHLRVSPGRDVSFYEQMIGLEMFIPHYSRRFEIRVRGFRDFEPRTSNFVSLVSLESGIHACSKSLMNHAS